VLHTIDRLAMFKEEMTYDIPGGMNLIFLEKFEQSGDTTTCLPEERFALGEPAAMYGIPG
jgi:hypothetical protein